ncbi:hypothetical protein BD289DRAFT_483517 [Coniella lustricola]|uniref:Uncharacterized protein n=1 Tax=Coniella lustricola TaxID=2025994 RepID=A0A2T3A522_9PEZI|nr:hypothetical protein BD289DRAFT_483517 [Coniella lustricola]
MTPKYHTQILSEERSKDGRGVIIRERPVKCTGTSDCEFCTSDRRSRRPTRLEFAPISGGRDTASSRSSSVKDRLPTPYNFEYKPVRRASRDAELRERRPSERDHYYSDGERMGDYNLRRSSISRSAAQPIPIPKAKARRSSTAYEDDLYDRHYGGSFRRNSERDSWRRSSPPRHESARVYPGFYDVLGSSASSKASVPPSSSSSPRPSRHRRRHSVDIHQAEPTISYGSSPVTNSYHSTPYGSYNSSDLHSRATSISQSLPKSVRWGDDPRARQNAKIESRPKLSRSASISGAGTGPHLAGEVKSILKKSSSPSEISAKHTEALSSSSSPPAVQAPPTNDQYEALYQSAQRMGIEDRTSSSQRKLNKERAAAPGGEYYHQRHDSRDMMDNLRKRMGGDRRYSFDSPPRRFAMGSAPSSMGGGRRAEAFYDDRYDDRRW